jgi:hypothetical protein
MRIEIKTGTKDRSPIMVVTFEKASNYNPEKRVGTQNKRSCLNQQNFETLDKERKIRIKCAHSKIFKLASCGFPFPL